MGLKEDVQTWGPERLDLVGTRGKRYLTEDWRRHRQRQMMMKQAPGQPLYDLQHSRAF